ncbi:MAG: serine hydrolase [Anaerolineae bacterium]|nr:serine hydrolase [Anaerolineae bacterium]
MHTKTEHDLPRSTPEIQGIASAAILRFAEAVESKLHEMHSFVLLRHGSVVAEGWWSPYGREHPHLLFSVSKSVTATAVGLALAEGHFSIDDPVLPFFPDAAPAEVNDHLKALRVRHLLSMSTGHADDTWANMLSQSDGNWLKGFFEVPISYAPGSHFLYNTGASYVLAAIVQKTTGMKLLDYLQPRLFEPLGIGTATWEESPQGIAMGGIGLSLKTEDLARFGQLYLQKGRWQDRQILSEAWVAEATATQIANGDDPQSDWAQGYGYQFWRCRHNAYRGDGVFGQFCIVMPEQDAVLAMTGGIDIFEAQQPLNLVWDILLPAMEAEPLVDDPVSQQRLTEKLHRLSLPSLQKGSGSALASEVTGRTYKVDANELQVETITLNFSESDCTLSITRSKGEETIPCGYATWLHGQTSLFNEESVTNPQLAAACASWLAADSLKLIVRLYETPFYYTLVFHFVGTELMLETQVNVSLGSTRPLLLTAHTL